MKNDIGYLVKQLSSAFRRRMDERLRHRALDLSMAHITALFTLQDEPGLAGAQLARRSMISAQAMNSVLRRLEREGYTVATAEDGRQALEMARAQRFDLLLLDMMMPEMSGLEVLLRLKADSLLRDIPADGDIPQRPPQQKCWH